MDKEQQAWITEQLEAQLTQEQLTAARKSLDRGDEQWIPNEFGDLELVLDGGKIRAKIVFPRPPDPRVN